ncbi:MAG: hypothetical protein WBC97_03055 [Gemmatimonadales bacterium]
MLRIFAAALAAGLLASAVAPRWLYGQSGNSDTSSSARHSGTSPSPMATMTEPLGIPHSRMGSGTSWIPDASAIREYQQRAGRWMLMAHGVVDLYYDHQGTSRGDTQVGSTNWLMGMAMRPIGHGTLQLDAMLSAEPFTVGGRGYPLLLQTGESYQGQPLHDRQHPHDLFMELSATYRHPLGGGLAVSLYAAPVGEPALGPVAFMHRPSAQSDPFAPIVHHWQDATHITFGVATIGIYSRTVKLEGSVFNGREPDEDRYNFDLRALDSWSTRLDVNLGTAWSLNASYGLLRSPEALDPGMSLHRIGASIMRTVKMGHSGEWATSLIWGANHHRMPGGSDERLEHSLLAETNLQLDDRNTLYGRVAWVEKSAEELVVSGFPATAQFNVVTASLGYSRELLRFAHTALSLGLRGEVGFVPSGLQPAYGTRNPAGIAIYARLRPAASARDRDVEMPMEGMSPTAMSRAVGAAQ